MDCKVVGVKDCLLCSLRPIAWRRDQILCVFQEMKPNEALESEFV